MNGAHLHLLINHFPVLGTLFGLGLLAFAAWRKSADLYKAAWATLVLVAITAAAAYFTGEPAEDVLKKLPGFSGALVENHEDAAAAGFVGSIALGLASLIGLVWFRRGEPVKNWYSSLVLLGAITVVVLMSWTAYLGGQIRHSEFQAQPTTPKNSVSLHLATSSYLPS